MSNEYLDAANKISDLAEEFEQDHEVASVLRAGSLVLTRLGIARGAIVKTASVANDSEPLDAA